MDDIFVLGALKPKYDARDYSIAAAAGNYPASFELPWRPAIKNQGSVCSCVAHATSEILEYFNWKEAGITDQLSTDFIYGMQGVAFDRLKSGMYLRDACKIAQQYGDCYKATIKTNIEQPQCTDQLKEILTDEIYTEAYTFHARSYAQCKTDDAIKHALMNYGPVLASVKWYKKYKMYDGVLKFDTTANHGYHAIMVYGWNEKGWLCQNSWGKNWGKQGTFILPYDTGFREAWSFVDAENSNVIAPKRNQLFDILYKTLNGIINFIKRFLP